MNGAIDDTTLTDLIERERLACGVPGAAVAVVRDGEPILVRGFGIRDAVGSTGPRAVDGQTLFGIASSSKTFTAALIAQLVGEGRLSWDIPVREYLPELRLWDDQATANVTLRDMLSHRTGLPRHDFVWLGRDDAPDVVLPLLRLLPPSAPLRQTWQYNNLLYVTVGVLAERVLGQTLAAAFTERLLAPMGMHRTNLSLERTVADDNVATAHLDCGGPQPVPYRDTRLTAASGGVNSCADDLASWLGLLLSEGTVGGRQLVSSHGVRELQRLAIPIPVPMVGWPELETVGYGMGWFLDRYRGHRFVHHAGNMDGLSATISMLPDQGIGVAVLANLDRTSFRDSVPLLVYDRLLDLAPRPWGDRYRARNHALIEGPRAAADYALAEAAGTGPGRPWADYAGDYRDPAYGTISVETTVSGLTARWRDLELKVRHRDRNAFQLREDTLDVTMPAVFVDDFIGEVGGLRVVVEPSGPPVEFTREHLVQEPPGQPGALTGRYRFGPVAVLVAAGEDGALTLSVASGPAAVLRRRSGTTFDLAGASHRTVAFVLGADGVAEEVVVEGLGRLRRERDLAAEDGA